MNNVHYDEETLIEYFSGTEGQQQEIAAHLQRCSRCDGVLSSLTSFSEALRDPEVWAAQSPDPALALPSESRIDELRNLSLRMEFEEFEADQELARLSSRPVHDWRSLLSRSPRLHGAGAVHKLITAAHERVECEPGQALALADAAIAIGSRTAPAGYPASLLKDLMGRAHKERAIALRYLGRYQQGLSALHQAEGFFYEGSASLADLASHDYQGGCLLFYAERTAEAIPLIRSASEAYEQLGDTRRLRQTRALEAAACLRSGDDRGAISLWLSLLDGMALDNDLESLACTLANLGQAYLAIRHFDEAGKYFQQALQLQSALGITPVLLRVQWGMGRMLIATSRWEDGLAQLQETAEAFDRLEMASTAGLLKLEMAEVFLSMGRDLEARQLCESLVDAFQTAGMATSSITALAYLKEASARGDLTAGMLRDTRLHLEELPRQSTLLIAAPLQG